MRLGPACLASVVTATIALAACGGSGDGPGNRRALERPDLQRMLAQLAHEQHAAAVALVESDEGVWRGASGRAEGARRAAPGNRFGIASTTKTFVASVVLQLVEDGRLALDDTVEQHLPARLRDGRRITVRQLLNHTSGLSPEFLSELPSPAAQAPLLAPPGTTHTYSNTNYLVLGLIVEQVTGRRLDRVVLDRIIRPLRLRKTRYGRAGLPSSAAGRPAWLGTPEEADGGDVGGAGGIVSTTGDLGMFFSALMAGDVVGDDLLNEMRRTVAADGPEAGLGIFRFDLPCGRAWGHGGDEPSYANQVLASPDGSRVVVVAQNTLGWPSARATAERMFCAS